MSKKHTMPSRLIELEHELSAALIKVDDQRELLRLCKEENEEKRQDIVYLATEKAKLEERIKRLEDVLQTAWFLIANVNWKRKKDPDMYKDFVNWRDNDFLPVMRWQKRKDTKAKEAKL